MRSEKELLAEFVHTIWSEWMKYLFDKTMPQGDGELICESEVKRWKRQMNTPYKNLPKKEKASDCEIAGRILEIINKDGRYSMVRKSGIRYYNGRSDGKRISFMDKIKIGLKGLLVYILCKTDTAVLVGATFQDNKPVVLEGSHTFICNNIFDNNDRPIIVSTTK